MLRVLSSGSVPGVGTAPGQSPCARGTLLPCAKQLAAQRQEKYASPPHPPTATSPAVPMAGPEPREGLKTRPERRCRAGNQRLPEAVQLIEAQQPQPFP